jgi:hypothetical protein
MSTTPQDEFDALRTITQALDPFSSEERARLLRWASERLGVADATARAGTSDAALPPPGNAGTGAPSARIDIKSFVAEKQPKNDLQFAAVVAYYYRFEAPGKKDSITKDDLIAACRLTGRDRPPAPQQTLRNAVNAGLLDSSGAGTFTINTVGENLVAVTLPGDGPTQAAGGRRKRAWKKPAKKATAKAAKKAPKKAAARRK